MKHTSGLGGSRFSVPGGKRRDAGTPGGLRIRTRLALLYGTLFLAGGTVLLFVQYLAVNRILGDKGQVITSAPLSGASGYPGSDPASPLPSAAPTTYQPPAQTAVATVQAQVQARFVDFKGLVLDSLVGQSLITLGVLALVAAGLGWWTAGRSLARLHTVTSAARRISERNLHDRLALVGPDDEIKELGDTFDAMLGRLERAFAANRRFAANASHELRTPLALQRTSLEIPLAEGRVPDDLRPSIERSLRATDRSERLVGSLLMLAKGQQGPESYAEADLADLARAAVHTYRADAASAGIIVTTDLERAPTAGDPVLLEQVAANLV
ncbi:MAG: HAMP domain-containing protein, partial [Streptomycetaceae bacterium]|nr:HAMP domain-containing protein [Streptomycetaceae bacterium]